MPLKKKSSSTRSSIQIPETLDDSLLPIAREVARIHESVEFSAQNQFEQAKIWRAINLWVGAPAAVMAALGGTTILGSSSDGEVLGVSTRVIGGILALAAAALTAITTTVNATRRGTQAQNSANAYLEVQTEARQLLLIDLADLSIDDARQALQKITDSRNELNKTADPPGRRAYRLAGKRILGEGGQDYAVDKTEEK